MADARGKIAIFRDSIIDCTTVELTARLPIFNGIVKATLTHALLGILGSTDSTCNYTAICDTFI
jgi:hypothetical protein